MDRKKKKILTSMFSKPLNLYLYIPPHSCHSHGIIQGLVYGHFIRIHILCSKEKDILKESRLFLQRLQARGYDTNKLSPLLLDAEKTPRNTPTASSPAKTRNPKVKPTKTFTFTSLSIQAIPTKKLKMLGAQL